MFRIRTAGRKWFVLKTSSGTREKMPMRRGRPSRISEAIWPSLSCAPKPLACPLRSVRFRPGYRTAGLQEVDGKECSAAAERDGMNSVMQVEKVDGVVAKEGHGDVENPESWIPGSPSVLCGAPE